MSILLLVLVVLLQVTGKIGEIWKSSVGKISAYQSARSGFATITRTLARATLNTYNDYVDAAGTFRDPNNPNAFVPVKFLRQSELHFISGPTSQILTNATTVLNPGHAVFFQAPLGETATPAYSSLERTVNSVGFYIEYGSADDASVLPAWLTPFFTKPKRFRLMEAVQPTEKLGIYKTTSNASYTAMIPWLDDFKIAKSTPVRTRIIAEDVFLLVLRPRLAPKDEETLAGSVVPKIQYNTDPSQSNYNVGSILSPNYNYDSRAWQTGYPPGTRAASGKVTDVRLIPVMRNQAPPIIDVIMVCVDRRSLARFDFSGATPPAPLQLPAASFTDSARIDTDLTAYAKQLSDLHVRFRTFRTSIDVQSAKWSALQ